jgi:hypothetical protein
MSQTIQSRSESSGRLFFCALRVRENRIGGSTQAPKGAQATDVNREYSERKQSTELELSLQIANFLLAKPTFSRRSRLSLV